jgi:hypothetical protein
LLTPSRLVGQLARHTTLTVNVGHEQRAVRQLRAVDGARLDEVSEVRVSTQRLVNRGLADTVLPHDEDGALVAYGLDEGNNLLERKKV